MGDARAKESGAPRDAEREKDATFLRSTRTGRRAVRRTGYEIEILRSVRTGRRAVRRTGCKTGTLRSVRTGRRAIRRIGYKTETLRSGGPAEERPERAGYHQRTIVDYKRSLEDVRTGPTAAFLRSAESLRTTN